MAKEKENLNLWTDCKLVPITKLLSFIVDNRGKTVPTSDNGWKLIATNCVTNKTLYPIYEKVRYLTQDTYENWFRAHPIPGDILFVNKGTPGRVCLVPDHVDFCIAQDMIALRADSNKIYNRYLFAILRSNKIQSQIYNSYVGDVIPHFKKQFMDQLLIPVPDVEVQRKIGDLYFNLSNKIELNAKINANLEAQAQALFNNLLNDSGDDSCSLSDYAEINPKRVLIKNSTAAYIEMANLSTNSSIPQTIEYKKYTGGVKFKNGDTVLARITPCLENGKSGFINYLHKDEVGFGSTEYIVLSSKGDLPSQLLYCLTKNKDFLEYAIKNMNGSSGRQRVSGESIGAYTLPVFNIDVLKQIRKPLDSLFKQIRCNYEESARLRELRDSLLPKLMRGEI